MKKIAFIIFLFFTSFIYSQEVEQQTSIKLNGVMRFRGFYLTRDTPLNKTSPSYPIYNPQLEFANQEAANAKLIKNELDARIAGKPSTLTKAKEKVDYFDSRILLNLEFYTSKYLDGVAGVQIGDMTYGGKSTSNTDRNTPANLGSGTGGELGQQTPVNLRTNFLYINFKLKEYDFTSRYGIQFFSSPLGRLVYAIGSGAMFTKGIPKYQLTLESGWIRSRERTAADLDGNGFNDKRQNVNIVFFKAKFSPTTKYKVEIYNYTQFDKDQTDLYRETGNLFWWGIYNEWNLGTFNMIAHGIYNHGNLKASQTQRDLNQKEIFQHRNEYSISGGLWDLQLSYIWNPKIKFNLIGLGTTGSPGSSKDGVPSSYRGGGYRTIFPDFNVSNIAIDWAGGYALFSARDIGGMYEVGSFVNIIAWGPVEFTLGYYLLYANRVPVIDNNRDFNMLYGKHSSTLMGQEYNLNIRWIVQSDFQLLLRSGYFQPGDGLKALNDNRMGSYLKEAFLSAEYKF